MICGSIHKVKNHKYRVIRCMAKTRKIFTHIISKYTNCEKNYQATAFKYLVKLKVQTEV